MSSSKGMGSGVAGCLVWLIIAAMMLVALLFLARVLGWYGQELWSNFREGWNSA